MNTKDKKYTTLLRKYNKLKRTHTNLKDQLAYFMYIAEICPPPEVTWK